MTVHRWFVAVASHGVVAAKHVFRRCVVAMTRSLAHASETCVVGVVHESMSPTITATSWDKGGAASRDNGGRGTWDDGSGCGDSRVGSMAAAKSGVGGCHGLEAAEISLDEVRLKVRPRLFCSGLVVPHFDGCAEDAGVLEDFLRGTDESAVVDGVVARFCKFNNVSDA